MTNDSHPQHPVVTGLLNDLESVERSFEAARARGYTDPEIDVVISDPTRSSCFGKDVGKATAHEQ